MSSAKKGAKSKTTLYVKYYLITYNILSFLGWSSVLLFTLAHLLGFDILPLTSHPAPPLTPPKPASFFSSLFSPKPQQVMPPSRPPSYHIPIPKYFAPYYARTNTTYASVGSVTACVQSAAALEVIHVLVGWVHSPLMTTAMQVTSRLFLVWGITWGFEQTRTNPFYTSMILSWSLTEAIRYSFYAFSLVPSLDTPKFLVYLRYTTFFVLYPLGAGSEAALIWASVPDHGKWGIADWARVTLFAIWWPGLYVMYTYMIKQRRKVFSKHHHEVHTSDPDAVDAAATSVHTDAAGRRKSKRTKAS